MSDDNQTGMQNWMNRAGTVGELYRYFAAKRRWALFGLLTVLILLSIVLVTMQAVQFLAPFVYTIF